MYVTCSGRMYLTNEYMDSKELLELMSPNIVHEHKCVRCFFWRGEGGCLVLIDGNEWLHGLVH